LVHASWVVFMIVFFVFGFPAFIAYSLLYMSRSHKVVVQPGQGHTAGWSSDQIKNPNPKPYAFNPKP